MLRRGVSGERERVGGVSVRDLHRPVAAHQHAIVALLEAWAERAAIVEHDGGLPRAEAERLAWEEVTKGAVSAADLGASS